MRTPLLLFAAAPAGASGGTVHYAVDETWRPAFPPGTGTFSAVDAADGRVYIGQRSVTYANPILVFDHAGGLVSSFGGDVVATGVHHNETEYGVHGVNLQRGHDVVWVTDFLNHTVVSFDKSGRLLGVVGRGASAAPGGFDAPSDIAFRRAKAYIVDGDGGVNMRVARWAAGGHPPVLSAEEWIVPATPPAERTSQEFDHPHSLAWHQASDTIVVCDRDHWRIVLLNPETGAEVGNLTCDLQLGPGSLGRPFGVRAWRNGTEDLFFVAVSGNEGVESAHQFVYVIDASAVGSGGCGVLQTIPIDPARCHTPHLLGLDQGSGEVYVACDQEPNGGVLRLSRTA